MTAIRDPAKPIAIAKEDGALLEITIYDLIGRRTWDDSGVTAKEISKILAANKDATRIVVYINSAGGDVFEGVTIYNQLVRHKARVEVNVDGMALSIASLIAMAGDEIHIAENAMMMIHDPWNFAMGTADDLREAAERLDKVKDTLVKTYAARTKRDEAEISQLMADETWFSAEEAVEQGFANEVTEAKTVTACAGLDRMHFRHMPRALTTALKMAARPTAGTPIGRRSAMEDTKKDTQALDAAKAEGAKAAREDLEALKAAFPDDSARALDAAAKGLSVEAAKAAAYDDLRTSTTRALAEKDTAIKALEDRTGKMEKLLGSKGMSKADIEAFDPSDVQTPEPPKAAGQGADDGKPETFDAAVEAHVKVGKLRSEALALAGEALPKSFKAWTDANQPNRR